ncbi:hypothetical protein RB653_004502 [Dictyostelium firmibasis]|uniref:Cleavage stimulation factor 50 kDa subunit n=1 Tax=Dictyostelium firmibasis TaxID=79012 RepID=A0AAN7U9U1_9MYCE
MKEEQRDLYSLIINQLVHDGYLSEATKISESTMIPCPIKGEASNKLFSLYQSTISGGGGLGMHGGINRTSSNMDIDDDSSAIGSSGGKNFIEDIINMKECLDFDDPTQQQSNGTSSTTNTTNTTNSDGDEETTTTTTTEKIQQQPNFITKFITTHKNACRCAKFSWDGKFVATGSSDTSIKLLDVNKMRNYNQTKNETTEDSAPSRPVIRTFYDHTMPINDLDFHPSAPILSSASKDGTIRFYDYKSSLKRSFKYIQDTHGIRSINFHPCGDLILAGTDHQMIRLYNVNTFQSFTARKINEHHHGSINQVRFSLDGSIFASCSKDNTIKIWDSNNFSLISTLNSPHNGKEPTTVQISRNQKYLLSCGRDSMIKLWEITSGRLIYSINTGVNQSGGQNKNRISATFNYTEDYIITNDEQPSVAVVYNSRTKEQVQKLTGHNNTVRYIAASPVENALMTCSLDHRGRFWTDDTLSLSSNTTNNIVNKLDIDI